MKLYQPFQYLGASFVHTALANGAATTLVAAAANVNGLILRELAFYLAGGSVNVFADTLAPASLNDVTRRMIFGWQNTITPVPLPPLTYPLRFSAGVGLFAWSATAGNFASAGYDLE